MEYNIFQNQEAHDQQSGVSAPIIRACGFRNENSQHKQHGKDDEDDFPDVHMDGI